MHLILVTSLDGLSRNSAVFTLAGRSSDTPVVLHDLLDGGEVVRRVHVGGELVERETMILEHGCLSCTVRFDLAPSLLRLARKGVPAAIVGLPPGTTAENAIDGLRTVAPRAFSVRSVALAVRPEDVEDQVWDRHTLFQSGYTAVPEDSRTPGEYLVGEFLFADTVLTTASDLLPADPSLRRRGRQLIGELAPHAVVVDSGATEGDAEGEPDRALQAQGSSVLGFHDECAARARSLPGVVGVPVVDVPTNPTSSSPFRTLEHRVQRPLHADRFRTALGAIAQGCCFVRGAVWISGVDAPITVHGVGPRISLANGGTWSGSQEHGEWCRGTHLALTGDELDDADIINLLDACALTDEEMHADIGSPGTSSSARTSATTEGAP